MPAQNYDNDCNCAQAASYLRHVMDTEHVVVWPHKRVLFSHPGRLGCGLFSLP